MNYSWRELLKVITWAQSQRCNLQLASSSRTNTAKQKYTMSKWHKIDMNTYIVKTNDSAFSVKGHIKKWKSMLILEVVIMNWSLLSLRIILLIIFATKPKTMSSNVLFWPPKKISVLLWVKKPQNIYLEILECYSFYTLHTSLYLIELIKFKIELMKSCVPVQFRVSFVLQLWANCCQSESQSRLWRPSVCKCKW